MNGVRPLVSGKTKAKRGGTITPGGGSNPLPGTPGNPTVSYNPDGTRVVSGKTKAARAAAAAAAANSGTTTATGSGTTTDSGGQSYNADGSRVVSGATKAARATSALIASVEKYFLLGALVVGSIYVIRHFHLLTGGASGGGGGGGRRHGEGGGRHVETGQFTKGG